VQPHPAELRPFFRFVQQHVLEHSTGKTRLGASDYADFAKFMLGHGLSLGTVWALIRQLLSEPKGNEHWKRAALLDRIQFDVFSWYYRKIKPSFSTFFSNSTAHYQHFYWREMEPHLFKVKPTPQSLAAHETSIRYGYEQMDKMIARFLQLADPDTVVIFATALSQQACLAYEEQGGKVMFRPRDFAQLLQFAGVTERTTVAPVMAEVFNVHLQSEADAQSAEAKLLSVTIDGKPAIHVQRKGNVLNAKCQVHAQMPASTQIACGPRTSGFFELFFQLEDIKSGMHHPDGMLWIRLPERRHGLEEAKVPLASVAPTVLRLLQLPCPPHMQAPPIGV
jgi:hypothetical protein